MTESVLLWSVAAVLVAAIVLPFAISFRRRHHKDRERKVEAAALGLDRPSAQFPYIDPALCIGCGACVAACPEGDVLGVVGGTATVINGMRCVGHARCEEACPVNAITVGLGDMKGRADMPQVDEWNETDTAGLFLAGEVRGLALVKNAIGQGRKVIERIAERVATLPPAPEGTADVIIVGAGPAGLSAALAATERGLSFLVLEQEGDLGGSLLHYPRRKMVLLQPVDLPLHGRLAREEYQKEDFLALMEKLVKEHRLNIKFGHKVTGVRRIDEGFFEVGTADDMHWSRAVILCVGRRGTPRKLDVPGEEHAKVMYRLIDAEGYRGQRVLIVGGGDSAVEAAIGLAQQPDNVVTLSYRRDKLVRIKKKNQDRFEPLVADGRIKPIFGSRVVEVLPDRVRLEIGSVVHELANDFVFVFAGGEPPFDFLKHCGVRFGGTTAPPRAATAPPAPA
jgi:thioredoxin reductase/NAD-dependent dihydropyrimidine dehydrogenase PreA subunit